MAESVMRFADRAGVEVRRLWSGWFDDGAVSLLRSLWRGAEDRADALPGDSLGTRRDDRLGDLLFPARSGQDGSFEQILLDGSLVIGCRLVCLASLGKPVGGDLREGKVTLAAIHLLRREGRPSRAHDIVRSVVETGEIPAEEWNELVALLRERRAIQYAHDKAVEYAAAAKDCLDAFPPSPERAALGALPDFVLARDR